MKCPHCQNDFQAEEDADDRLARTTCSAWRESTPDKEGWWWRRKERKTSCVFVQADEASPEFRDVAWGKDSLWSGPIAPPPLPFSEQNAEHTDPQTNDNE